jgi:CrcB protein
MRFAAFVGLGSALGGVARFWLSTFLQQRTGSAFPVGTFVVNVSGGLLLGLVIRYALATPAISLEMRVMLTTGFCGGFTTFSTYSYETATLLESGDYRRATAYAITSVVVSLIATFVGFMAARELLAWQGGA